MAQPESARHTAPPNTSNGSFLTADQDGYHKGLTTRHIQMIAIGSAIGTGLFLGAGGRLASAGPSLILAYLVCGFFAFLVLRAVGELVLHRPSSGAVVSYSREFLGESPAYFIGWIYFLCWALTGIADTTAIATYLRFWPIFQSIPQWVLAFAALLVVLALNTISVKVFGEMEFWFSLLKVVAIIAFLCVGLYFVLTGHVVEGQAAGLHNITSHGGWFPNGLLPMAFVTSGVIFAYYGIEIVATAAGETKDAKHEMPRAVNNVVWRIIVFYCGSVFLLSMLLPYTAYSSGESPFVTFFSKVGVSQIGDVMNFVVITAALSSLNAGLYSTGRIIRTMAHAGAAPERLAKMNSHGVPFGGIVLTSAVIVIGVVINYLNPGKAFDIAMNMVAVTIVLVWSFLLICQMRLKAAADKGLVERPSFRMPLSPFSNWVTLAFLAAVMVLIAVGDDIGRWTVIAAVPVLGLIAAGWFLVRNRIDRRRSEHEAGELEPTAV
ncbi:amino acid permease [Corynebacterium heidelbergense]|uniref:L-asparagine permease n=1 Tax=Corynebacterium heidelbergense TaxID=2055947 RepID=A0A364VBS0_9CORY|nr:amino acid permease [Corynebacterium heidelbergense]RAV34064.1 L-asparagine permease [Corynebacterium heidelbergense]WCZ36381.1 D-serine/D-alanine/glycine transporter [Corynebacterium heidelbergense]